VHNLDSLLGSRGWGGHIHTKYHPQHTKKRRILTHPTSACHSLPIELMIATCYRSDGRRIEIITVGAALLHQAYHCSVFKTLTCVHIHACLVTLTESLPEKASFTSEALRPKFSTGGHTQHTTPLISEQGCGCQLCQRASEL
jgi:hypothetical protein